MQYIQPTKIGDLTVTMGAVSFNEIDVFSRNPTPNFIQIELDHKVMDNLVLMSRVQHLNLSEQNLQHLEKSNYLNEQIQFSPVIAGKHAFSFVADALYDFDTQGITAEAGVTADVGSLVKQSYKDYFTVSLFADHLSEKTHAINIFNNAYFVDDNLAVVRIGGKLGKAGIFSWSARDAIGLSKGSKSRLDINFAANIHWKRQK